MNTPLLLLSKQTILKNYNELKKALPGFRIAYAIKANPHEKVIETLSGQGSDFEIASIYELEYLLKQNIDAGRLVFSNPVKKIESIERALELGVPIQSFDSIGELEKFKPFKDRVKPVFRIHVPNTGSIWPLSQKFGLSEKFWPGIFSYMRDHQIPLAGLTFHVGSQCESVEGWHQAMKKTWAAIKMANDYGLRPGIINIGGGFPIFLGRTIPNAQQIGQVVQEHLHNWQKAGYQPEDLVAEPGRYISGSAGVLQTSIIGVAERDDKTLVFTDCGVFSGLMESVDGMTYPVQSTGRGKLRRVTLTGPSCDSLDTMFETDLPNPTYGDVLSLSGTGAYSLVYASRFNGFPEPTVEFTDDEIDNVRGQIA